MRSPHLLEGKRQWGLTLRFPRDFCYIDNVIQANLLAATRQYLCPSGCADAANQVYNVAVGDRATLNQLFEAIRALLAPTFPHLAEYPPTHRIGEGLAEAMDWYVRDLGAG